LILRFIQGMSVAETADILRRSEGSVKQLQWRAIRRLAMVISAEMR
jgi:RNA polymerase sigma-70 factor, ECF subfamily